MEQAKEEEWHVQLARAAQAAERLLAERGGPSAASSSSSPTRRKKERKKKKLPKTSSSCASRTWRSGHYSTKPLCLPVLRPVSMVVRQRIRVHASVVEVSRIFPSFL